MEPVYGSISDRFECGPTTQATNGEPVVALRFLYGKSNTSIAVAITPDVAKCLAEALLHAVAHV